MNHPGALGTACARCSDAGGAQGHPRRDAPAKCIGCVGIRCNPAVSLAPGTLRVLSDVPPQNQRRGHGPSRESERHDVGCGGFACDPHERCQTAERRVRPCIKHRHPTEKRSTPKSSRTSAGRATSAV